MAAAGVACFFVGLLFGIVLTRMLLPGSGSDDSHIQINLRDVIEELERNKFQPTENEEK